jgi:hypothetical protein
MSEETESLLKQTAYRTLSESTIPVASAEASSVSTERLGSDSSGLWIRSFLIKPGTYNSRGWAIDRSTALQNVYSIVGKPLVLSRDPKTGRADHPVWNEKFSAEANVRAQSSDAIGVVKRVYYNEDDDSYYADSLVTDKAAIDYLNGFANKKLPIPVSPQLVYNPNKNLPNYYSNWEFSHLAVVDKAAYGPSAAIVGACEGNEETCHKKLQRAAVITAAASASASASASAIPGYELQRDCSSADAFLAGSKIYAPANGKIRGRIA